MQESDQIWIILSFFDEHSGPEVLESIPALPPELGFRVAKIMDIQLEEGFFLHSFDSWEAVNYFFFFPSPHARGEQVIAMVSLLTRIDVHEPTRFQALLRETAGKVLAVSDGDLVFFEGKGSKRKHKRARAEIRRILEETRSEARKIHGATHLGQLLLLGLDQAGKTSLTRVLQDPTKPNLDTTPTLGVNIVRLVMSEMKVTIFDIGGQQPIRDQWTTTLTRPHGLVYVQDLSITDPARLEESVREFKRVLEALQPFTPLPVLLVGNKLDLVDASPRSLKIRLNKRYRLPTAFKPHRTFLMSAKTGTGVLEGFRWLVTQLVKLQ